MKLKSKISAVVLGAILTMGSLMFAVAPLNQVFAQDDYVYDYSYSTSTSDMTDEEAAAFMAFMAAYMGFILCMAVVLYVYSSLTLSTIGRKLGATDSWMAWVPLLNYYYMVKIAGEDTWKFILLFIPFINVVYMIILWMKLAERRGFPNWYGILILVPFIGFFVPAYLAWAEPK